MDLWADSGRDWLVDIAASCLYDVKMIFLKFKVGKREMCSSDNSNVEQQI